MNQANNDPVEMAAEAQANLAFIEGLMEHEDIDPDVLRKAVQETRSLLDALSVQLQQRRLT